MRVQRRRVTERWSWLDVRLALPAGAVWSTTLVLAGVGWPTAAATAATGVVAGLLVGRWAGTTTRWGWTVVSLLAGVTAASLVGAVHRAEQSASPLTGLAARGAVTSVVLTVDEVPHPLAGGPGPARVLVAATVTSVPMVPSMRPAAVLLFGAAEDWAEIVPGTQLRVRGVLRPAEPGDDVLAVLSARAPPETLSVPGLAGRVTGGLRSGLAATSDRMLPPRPAGLLPGLVVGDTTAMDPVLTGDFRRAGLAHLTAVSGANVAIVLALLLWPLRRRAVDRRVQAAAGVLGILGFVALAGPSPSVVRAAAMGVVALLALATGRARAAVPALAASVVVLLLADPSLADDAGFALSVAATAGIVLLAPGWSRRLRRHRLPGPVADALAVSAAAGLLTAPLVAGLSGLVSLVSLPANLLAAPAVAPATVLGLLATLTAPVSPALADLLVWLAGWPTRWLVVVAERAAAVPDGATGWPAGTAGALLLAALLMTGAAVLTRWPRTRALALAALVGIVVLGWPARQATIGWPVPGTVLVACDVGQGDALVLPTSAGAGILVDTGPDPALVDGCLTRLGIDDLPLVLLSHLDADHAGGLVGALTGRDVGVVATGVLGPGDDRLGGIRASVTAAGGELTSMVAGDARTVGTALVEVLAPRPTDATPGIEPNALSMLVRITQHGLRVLTTGDLGADTEARLLRRGLDLRADVLKVPHHGSGDNAPAFLAATGARVAVISVGAENTYGHPTARLLDWLTAEGMQIHRTDREGDVAISGSAGSWGVAARGSDSTQHAVAAAAPPPIAVPAREPAPAVLVAGSRAPRWPGRRAGTARGPTPGTWRVVPESARPRPAGDTRWRVGGMVLRDTMTACPAQRPRPPPPGCGW